MEDNKLVIELFVLNQSKSHGVTFEKPRDGRCAEIKVTVDDLTPEGEKVEGPIQARYVSPTEGYKPTTKREENGVPCYYAKGKLSSATMLYQEHNNRFVEKVSRKVAERPLPVSSAYSGVHTVPPSRI